MKMHFNDLMYELCIHLLKGFRKSILGTGEYDKTFGRLEKAKDGST